MQEITLEKVDKIIERTGVTYGVAKVALEECKGNVLDAIVYIEDQQLNVTENNPINDANSSETIEEFKVWLKDLIKKGNVSRVKVKKDDNVLVDIPVNAGIAATVIAIIIPQILAFGVIAAVATKLTIEITMSDGSVQVVNKYVSKAADEVKEKATSIVGQLKDKVKEVKNNEKISHDDKQRVYTGEETVYSYRVNFDEVDKDK